MQKGNKIAHKKKHTAKKKQQKTDLRATDTAKKGTKWNSNNDQTEPYVKKSIGKQANEAGKEQGIRWLSVSQKRLRIITTDRDERANSAHNNDTNS